MKNNEKFLFQLCEISFLEALLGELSRASASKVCDWCEYDHERQSHAIDFSETTEPEGFPHLDEQIEPDQFWQFGLLPSKKWRVHGFFLNSVFYIVWFDPKHNLYGLNMPNGF